MSETIRRVRLIAAVVGGFGSVLATGTVPASAAALAAIPLAGGAVSATVRAITRDLPDHTLERRSPKIDRQQTCHGAVAVDLSIMLAGQLLANQASCRAHRIRTGGR
jgi:hypothetical protein